MSCFNIIKFCQHVFNLRSIHCNLIWFNLTLCEFSMKCWVAFKFGNCLQLWFLRSTVEFCYTLETVYSWIVCSNDTAVYEQLRLNNVFKVAKQFFRAGNSPKKMKVVSTDRTKVFPEKVAERRKNCVFSTFIEKTLISPKGLKITKEVTLQTRKMKGFS